MSDTCAIRQLVSIVIPCCNQVHLTELCIASLHTTTTYPYELIVIDNGSSDKTPSLLGNLSQHPSAYQQFCMTIHNTSNIGFASAINQGLQKARGRYLILLNNDTVLTPNWLDALLACAEHGSGLVGPVTNYAPPPQLVEPGYTSLNDLYPFARSRYQEYRGQGMHVDRLSGFCLLIKREVLDKIGMLDERFGLGFFEDDDLCFRARDAGFKLSIALDVYIHHFGSQTINSLQVSADELLTQNFAKFQAKWGSERTAGYRRLELPSHEMTVSHSSHSSSAIPAGPARVSLSMIVKNEESNLGACLSSIRDVVDEIVIVDTGSSDRTKEIAISFGAKLSDFPWIDSFAAARNVSLEETTGDYVFWMDADDRIDESNRSKLRQLFTKLSKNKKLAYVMQCLCLPDPITKAVTQVDHVRLFPRLPQLRWRYRVHEQILPSLRELGGDVAWTQIQIQHTGYQDPALRGRKLDRDLRLLKLEDQDHPDDPFTLFNLGSVCLEMKQAEEALRFLQRSLQRSQVTDSITRKLFALISNAERGLGRESQALQMCIEGRRHFPYDAELLFQEAILRFNSRDLSGAANCLETLLSHQESAHFASIDPSLRGSKSKTLLGTVYCEMNRPEQAVAIWRQVLADEPTCIPALAAWGDFTVRSQQWDELDRIANSLETVAPTEGRLLQIRRLIAQESYEQAREMIHQGQESHPKHPSLALALCHSYLKEGKDWPAAERALLEILATDPNHHEALHNLQILRSQHGSFV